MSASHQLRPEILAFYQDSDEASRLTNCFGQLEFVRTQEIIHTYLPPPPAVVYDVGGGSGPYSCWLAKLGYQVHLIEPVAKLLEQARQNVAQQPDYPLKSLVLGDARNLPQDDSSADIVLLFGPLYHLLEREQRLIALAEAWRVLRTGGILLAVGISRFASTLDGIFRGLINDPAFPPIMEQGLETGNHINVTDNLSYFTTAYLHRPEELQQELETVGFLHQQTLGIEGPAWLLHNLPERWSNPDQRRFLLQLIRKLVAEPSMLGASAHMMTIGQRP